MDQWMTLDALPPGTEARIQENRAPGGMGRRLTDLGFVPGETVRCLMRSAGGDPAAYWVRGTVIALRRQDARGLVVGAAEKEGP